MSGVGAKKTKGARLRAEARPTANVSALAPRTPHAGDLHAAFDEALDRLVAVRERLASRAPSGELADVYRRGIDSETLDAVRYLVRRLDAAIYFGEPEVVRVLRDRLRERDRAAWFETVAFGVEWTKRLRRFHESDVHALAADVREKLMAIDKRALALDVAHVERELCDFGMKRTRGKTIRTVAGLAAALATKCVAFGETRFEKARDAFDKIAKTKPRKST